MANRFGNNYRVAIGTETALGSGKTNATSIAWTEVLTLPDTIEMTADISPIETGAKTQTGLATLCETKRGYQNYTITVSGVLSHEHEVLLTAFGLTKAPANTYTMNKLPTAIPGLVILRVWSDAPTGNPADTYTVDKASGCQLMRLNITGSSGDMVRYEATFMAQTFAREATQEITGTDPGTVCTEGFNFGDVTASIQFGSGTYLKTFGLTIEHELADDASSFQNSNTRLATIPVKVGGELTYTTNYNTTGAYDATADSELHSDSALPEELIFENSTMTWKINATGQVTAYTLADPDRQMFENNVTERLVTDGVAYPLKIVVATAP